DENAASHVALGTAYKFTMRGGESMDDAAFERAGGNRSAIHVDFMIGSGDLDVDGVCEGGAEPIMRRGEWAAGPDSDARMRRSCSSQRTIQTPGPSWNITTRSRRSSATAILRRVETGRESCTPSQSG